MTRILLPAADRRLDPFDVPPPRSFDIDASVFPRVAFAAAHVVADAWAACSWFDEGAIDWERTLAYRAHLWSHGLAVAEAMDTAQRGAGLTWPQAKDLIRRSAALARTLPGARLAAGAGTDHLSPDQCHGLDTIAGAYEHQIEAVQAAGAQVIVMASRALAASAETADDYIRVYDRILAQTTDPVILHWLGDMFDPALYGYWGSPDTDMAMETCLTLIERHAARIDGIKISLLDKDREIAMRRRLPRGVRMYTGDDFNFADLIEGDGPDHSDALLGIFDPIAPVAGAALTALGRGDGAAFRALLEPTVPLSRHIFQAPTRYYKTGVVFLAYLNGHQDHFTMLGGQQAARSLLHLSDLFRLAAMAGLLPDPETAVRRMAGFLDIHGISEGHRR